MKTFRLRCGYKYLLVVLLAAVVTSGGWANQGPAHILLAKRCLDQAPAAVRAVVVDSGNLAAYLAGATGPDIAGTTHFVQLAIGIAAPPGTEGHYIKTGELVVNMLKLAQNDQERAFALGWITHFWADCLTHALINDFGGYFEHDVPRHKSLELLECEHAFGLVEKDMSGAGPLSDYVVVTAAVPAEGINRAYAATYPDRPAYRPTFVPAAGVAVTLPPAFIANVRESAGEMHGCTAWMLACHQENLSFGQGTFFSTALTGSPPSPDEYKELMDPLLIDKVEFEPPDRQAGETEGKLIVHYTVNDLRLLKLFCDAWDKRMVQVVREIGKSFNQWAADPTNFTMPDKNLDTGGAQGSGYDAAAAWPGNPDIREMLGFLSITDPDGNEVSPWPADGEWVPCHPAEPETWGQWIGYSEMIGTRRENWHEGKAGSALFKVPFEAAESGPYHVKLRLLYARKADKKPYGVEAAWEGEFGAEPELSILFLVDCSGSMGGAKLQAAKVAVKASVDQTNDDQTEWCLVRFGGCGVRVVCRFTMDPGKIKAAADTLSSGGDTPLTYARSKALTYLTTRGRGQTGRLILLCDGQDNCPEHGGISQPEASAQLREIMRVVEEAQMQGSRGGTTQ